MTDRNMELDRKALQDQINKYRDDIVKVATNRKFTNQHKEAEILVKFNEAMNLKDLMNLI